MPRKPKPATALPTTLSMADARQKFGEILHRASVDKIETTITRFGRPIAVIRPAEAK